MIGILIGSVIMNICLIYVITTTEDLDYFDLAAILIGFSLLVSLGSFMLVFGNPL